MPPTTDDDQRAAVRAACLRLKAQAAWEREQGYRETPGLANDLELVARACEALLAAVEWYASDGTYVLPLTEYGWGSNTPIDMDKGLRAKAALRAAAAPPASAEGHDGD